METKIILDNRTPSKNNGNAFPVKLYLKFKGKNIYVSLNIYVYEWEFDKITGKIVDRKNATQLNSLISSKKTRSDSLLLELETQNALSKYTPERLKALLESGNVENNTATLFKPYFDTFIEKYKIGTKQTFKDTANKISKFADIETLLLQDITVSWLKDFDAFMIKGGLKTNTRGIYMRNIRTVINDAIDREIISLNAYPFRRFKIKKEETTHRAQDVEDLKKLRDYPCEESQKRYRDVYMLSFYLRGLNMVDILNLKDENVEKEYIVTKREKTSVPLKIKLEPEAIEIIERYKGKNYLLNIYHKLNF